MKYAIEGNISKAEGRWTGEGRRMGEWREEMDGRPSSGRRDLGRDKSTAVVDRFGSNQAVTIAAVL
jgi:hypothetical protein